MDLTKVTRRDNRRDENKIKQAKTTSRSSSPAVMLKETPSFR